MTDSAGTDAADTDSATDSSTTDSLGDSVRPDEVERRPERDRPCATDASVDGERVEGADVVAPDRCHQVLRLRCEPFRGPGPGDADARPDHEPTLGIGCVWSEVRHPDAVGYQLWRAVNDEGRAIIARYGLDTQGHRDLDVEAPGRYHYAVVAVDENGDPVARSRAEHVVLHGEPTIELACRPTDRGTEERRAVACKWTDVDPETGAAGYRLLRSTDGGPREVVHRSGLDQTTAVDAVATGHRYRYVVQAVTEDGRPVAHSQVVHVGIPPADGDPRPTDAAPVDPAPDDSVTREAS